MPTFLPAATAPVDFDLAYWFIFCGSKLHIADDDLSPIPLAKSVAAAGFVPTRTQFIGWYGETACFSAEIEKIPEHLSATFHGLRQTYGRVTDDFFWIASRAVQIVGWDRDHQFCGRCATPTEVGDGEHVRICPACGQRNYPHIAPAVIVAVKRDGRLLLARNRRHRAGMYTVLAGFVEAGETLEETVRREIKEEVGIEVMNIRYFGSQPWPFPNSLMVGFTADYAGGEFIFEDDDIEDAAWYTAENLPTLPSSPSIAHELIRDWLQSQPTD